MYIKKILGKVTLAGALFLSIVAILPIVLGPHVFTPIIERILTASNQELINEWQAMQDPSSIYYQIYGEANIGQLANQMFTGSADTTPMDAISSQASSLASVFTFGGTSILIIVGVVLETFRELEAQLTMRNYKGFL